MPAHAGGRAAHRADLVLVEADRHAPAGDHEDVVAAAGLDDPHELVAVAQVDGDQAVAATRVVGVERRLLHRPLAGGEEQVALAGEVAGVDDRLDRLAGLQRQQVDDRHALGGALTLGDVEGPQAVHLAEVGEEQQVGVGRGEDHVADEVVGLEPGPGDATATAGLGLELAGRDGLDVLRLGHHDDEFLVVDEVLDRHVAGVEGDLAHTRRGEPLTDRRPART